MLKAIPTIFSILSYSRGAPYWVCCRHPVVQAVYSRLLGLALMIAPDTNWTIKSIGDYRKVMFTLSLTWSRGSKQPGTVSRRRRRRRDTLEVVRRANYPMEKHTHDGFLGEISCATNMKGNRHVVHV